MMKYFLKIFFLANFIGVPLVSGQRTLEFVPVYGFQTFELNKYYPINKSDSVKIEGLRFYISNLQFINNKEVVFTEEESFHLLDVSSSDKLKWLVNAPSDMEFTHIRFNLGIDSITNVSGALSGDLDPTLGMYWTWQSGYINVKVEGKSNLCKTRLNEFSLHLGGYIFPNLAMQKIELKISNSRKFKIYFDIYSFLSAANLAEQNQVMSPGPAAVLLSEKFANIFQAK